MDGLWIFVFMGVLGWLLMQSLRGLFGKESPWRDVLIARGIVRGDGREMFALKPDNRSAKEIAPEKAYNRLNSILTMVLCIGCIETIDGLYPPREDAMIVISLWLAIPLTLLSGYGLFLLHRLRGLLGDRVENGLSN